MPLLYINTGTAANQGDGDNLRTAFTKVNQMFNEIYTVTGLETQTVPDAAAKVWLNPVDHYGIAYYYNTSTHEMHSTLLGATTSTLGGVKIGSGINISPTGVISVPPTYILPVATTATLGGVIVGNGLSINPITYNISNAGVTKFNNRTGNVTLLQSDVITALGYTPPDSATLGQPNGIATLDSSGKIPLSELSGNVAGSLNYIGTWDASANSPTLVSGTGTKGGYYKVSVAGTTSLDGIAIWNVGDLAIFNGTTWDKIDGIIAEVTSVAGRTGDVVLNYNDIQGGIPRSAFTATSTATATALGTVKIGAGIYAAADGTISVNQVLVTPATTSTLGVIKVGSGLIVGTDGTLSSAYSGTGGAVFTANQIGTTGTNDLILAPASGLVKVKYTVVTEGGNNQSVFLTNQFLNAGLATDSINFSLRIVGDLNNGTTLFDAGVYSSPTVLTGWTSKFLVTKTGNTTIQGNLTVRGSNGITFSDGSVQTTAVAQTTATTTRLGSVIVGNGLSINGVGVLSLAQGITGGTIQSLGPQTISSSTNPGSPGEVAWDGSYFYLCVDVNSWVRIALASPNDVPGAW